MSLNKMIMPLIRQEMELGVVAYNSCLKGIIKEMTDTTLLRNMHPLDRSKFAKQLHQNKLLSKDELKEFVDETD